MTLAGPLVAAAFMRSLTPAFFFGAFVGGATYRMPNQRRKTTSPIQQGLLAALLVPLFIPALLVLAGPTVLSYTVFQPRHFFSGDFDEVNCCDYGTQDRSSAPEQPETGTPWGLAFRIRNSGRPFVDLCGIASPDEYCLATRKGLSIDRKSLQEYEFQLTHEYRAVDSVALDLHGFDEIIFDRRYSLIIGMKESHGVLGALLGLSPTLELHVFSATSGAAPYVFQSVGTSIHGMEVSERAGKLFIDFRGADVNGTKSHKLKMLNIPML